jgi:hypothetical protein
VHSFDVFATVGRFNPGTGVLETFPREAGEPGPEGHFAELDGRLVVLYRAADGLRVACDGRSWRADASTVRWSDRQGERTFSLNEPGQPALELRYRPAELDADDLTPLADAEDWDFGLFVAEVVGDADRAARIYRPEAAR